ncbi:MAG: trypsin-like peptidase domain-containing protein [Solirubrobacteraceae bacterium]
MVHRRTSALIALALAALVLPATALALGLRAHAPRPARTRRIPKSATSTGVPKIGALYAGAGTADHGCTASVVHSSHGDTLITAAHCVSGSGAGMVFVPGQHGAGAPYGRWTVTAVHLASRWVTRQDPDDDVAFLTVAPQTISGVPTEIERVTGAFALGAAPRRGLRVTVTGYPAGAANDPITCSTTTYVTRSFPAFDCRGYVGGTSGSPWLRVTRSGTEVVGVIGGLNQGGCYDYTSYSSPLARDANDSYRRASEHAPADVAPPPGGDGC